MEYSERILLSSGDSLYCDDSVYNVFGDTLFSKGKYYIVSPRYSTYSYFIYLKSDLGSHIDVDMELSNFSIPLRDLRKRKIIEINEKR